MSTPVRTRFAPSPTGFLHIGAMRSALFEWLWARHTGGTFILRLEDTDRARLVPEAYDQIQDSLEALGIAPDEGPRAGGAYGPYVQSERLELYQKHAQPLIETGVLYRCWCSTERLTALRADAQKKGVAFKYDRYCLQPENHRSPDEPHVLRFRTPDAPESIHWDDAVRGRLEFRLSELDDFVAVKSDGFPTYHFANVVDDHLMEITHVLRADEWIPSTPKHLLLFAAFGWEAPVYGHLPAVQGPNGGKKLSKRDGAKSVQEYLAEGYLPEALRSFLASLGWNDGTTQEVYTTPELVKNFTLERIQKSPARFDITRLTWMNGLLLRRMSGAELLARSQGFWPASAASYDPKYHLDVLELVQERLKTFNELPELTAFFFTDPTVEHLGAILPSRDHEEATRWLNESLKTVKNYTKADFTKTQLEADFRNKVAVIVGLEASVGPLFMYLRIILTGEKATPGLFETMAVLGQETVVRRLERAARLLTS